MPHPTRPCDFSGCDRKTHRAALCSGHTRQKRRGEELRPLGQRKMGTKPCAFEGCGRETYTAEYCRPHTQQLRRSGVLKPLRETSPRGVRKEKSKIPCSFDTCKKFVFTARWCKGHYLQQYRGEPLRPLGQRLKDTTWTLERIFAECQQDDDCMLFRTEQVSKYPQVRFENRGQVVHRVVYKLIHGDIEGIPIHHKCGNSYCVNPDHLQKASDTENTLEMLGRQAYKAEIALLKSRIAELEAALGKSRD